MKFPTEKGSCFFSCQVDSTKPSPSLSAQTPGSSLIQLIGHTESVLKRPASLPPQEVPCLRPLACPLPTCQLPVAPTIPTGPWKAPGTLCGRRAGSSSRENPFKAQPKRPCLLCPRLLQQHLVRLRQDSSCRRETHKPPEKSVSRSCTFQKQSVFRTWNREMPTRKRCGLDFSVKQPRSV